MAAEQHARRGMSGGQIALVLVVAALVVVFLVMLAGRLTGDDDGGAAASPGRTGGTSAEPTPTGAPDATEEETTDDDVEPVTFAMPSGNIACEIDADAASCVISSFTYEAADAAACPEGGGGHLRVDEAGATMPCEPLVVAGDVAILDYGEVAAAHGFTCESSESGVTCRHDATGHGFALARSSYELF